MAHTLLLFVRITNLHVQKQQQQAQNQAEGGQKKKKVTAAQLRAQKGMLF